MITFFLSVPIIIKILISLAAIILLNKILSNQIVAILAGTVLLVLWVGHNPENAGLIAWNRFSHIDNIFLLVVVYIIILLSSQMKETGMMEDLVQVITKKFSRTTSMAVLPAVIGLLPMPGGAMFSAPLVNSCDPDSILDNSLKTRINYWFRHVWEYWWPLYPGVLLAIDISGLPVSRYMLFMFPISIFTIAGAWFFLLRKANKLNKTGKVAPEPEQAGKGFGLFLFSVSPIIMIMSIYSLLSIFFPVIPETSKYLPMTVGILVSIIYLQAVRPLPAGVWKKIAISKMARNLVILVALIRIYGAFIEGPGPDGTPLMEILRLELSTAGISPYLLILLIPLVCGISTGIAIATVGAAFPIVFSLIGPEPGFALTMSTTVLAYSLGHVGQLLSPVHVCLLVSNEYYGIGLFQSLKGLWKPALVVSISGILLSRLYLAVL